MIRLYIDVPYASFRKSFARSFAETYALAPPATVYGMLLSLAGENFRRRHEGVRLAFAYKCPKPMDGDCDSNCLPRTSTTLRKLSRFKYGVPSKQSRLGNAPDFVETVCGLNFLCWIDSNEEKIDRNGFSTGETLEVRVRRALESPHEIARTGVLCLGLSDDAVNEVSLHDNSEGRWHRVLSKDAGSMELPVWVDHVGAADTRWQRFEFEENGAPISGLPGDGDWRWTEIIDPRRS